MMGFASIYPIRVRSGAKSKVRFSQLRPVIPGVRAALIFRSVNINGKDRRVKEELEEKIAEETHQSEDTEFLHRGYGRR